VLCQRAEPHPLSALPQVRRQGAPTAKPPAARAVLLHRHADGAVHVGTLRKNSSLLAGRKGLNGTLAVSPLAKNSSRIGPAGAEPGVGAGSGATAGAGAGPGATAGASAGAGAGLVGPFLAGDKVVAVDTVNSTGGVLGNGTTTRRRRL
jgi:hypothetical protein